MVLKALAKDSAIYGGADFLSKLLAFFTFPLVAAALSPHVFGALELLVTATSLLGMVANCGLNNSLQRFYWDAETPVSERPQLVSSGLAAQVVLTLAAVFLGLATLLLVWPELESPSLPMGWLAIVAALVLMFANQITQYALDVIRLHMAPWRFLALALVSRSLSAIIGVIVVVYCDAGLNGLLVAQAIVAAAIMPLAMYLIRSELTRKISYPLSLKLIRFGHPFILSGLAFWLFGSMDRWMLASMSSIEEVGIYSVAYRFASVIMFVSVAFGQAWSPLAMKIRSDHPAEYKTLYSEVLTALGCGMLVLGATLALFATDLIQALMPSDYSSAAAPFAILSLGVVLQSTQQVTAIGISIEKKTYLFARLAWLSVALNFVLNLVLIPSLGPTGTALATTITYLVLTTSYMYFTQMLHPLPLNKVKLISWLILWVSITCVSAALPGWPSSPSLLVFKGIFLAVCIVISCTLIPWRGIHVK